MIGNKISLSGKIFDILNYLLLSAFTIACIYPFYYVFIYSVSDAKMALSHGVFLLPQGFSLDTIKGILKLNDIPNAFFISAMRTLLGTVITILCSSFFAYLVTKKELYFRKSIYRLVIITMYLNAGLIPWYLVMRLYGLKDNFLLYVLPGAVVAFFVILLKTYMEQIPAEMEESAKMDGAGYLTVFFRIIFPLSKPIVATVAVYASVGQWNAWIDNYFLVSDSRLQTMQMVLYNYLNQANRFQNVTNQALSASEVAPVITAQSVKASITVLVVIPILFVYPFLQRYFTKGIMMGAVKG